ncbi:NUC169 domain-containing protein [Diplogelasinospora grovesii]|uniref:Ribosome biogenesis protein ERB1 n=1 Tax=Diplogelasinospora grovesii TaxID=303347 RepID=A0AAN6NBI0_9PEZI|nr:NUC169 domain-containing protein [Diplogelasinospora grovesii]
MVRLSSGKAVRKTATTTMGSKLLAKKRKAQEPESSSDNELADGAFDGVLSQSEDEFEDAGSDEEEDEDFQDDGDDESGSGSEDAEDDDDALLSDDIPSDVDGEDEITKILKVKYGAKEEKLEITEPGVDPKPKNDGPAEGENYRIETDANGGVRYVYDEIDPVYDSDDSDAQGPVNTIGDIPLSFYDSYPHIGYDINGKKIMRPATGDALQNLLDSIEIPKGWTGLTDTDTGNPLNLSQDELELIKRVQMGLVPEEGYDPYPDAVDWFTNTEEKMPLSAAPEPKRRFLPSKNEAKQIMKLVRAIREGRILPYKPPEERQREEEEKEEVHFDLWQDEVPQAPNPMHIPAPKLPPPGYDLSYNPPEEYLPSKEEREEWEKTDPEERDKEYLPQKHNSLRKVPAWSETVKERFERCMDLYLAPRVRKNRLNIDPNSLLPKLPSPSELKPFPTVAQTVFRGHEGRVRSVAIDPSGVAVASGGDDGTVRVWDLKTGRQVWSVKLSSDEAVNAVRWRPNKDSFILSAAAGEDIFLMVPTHANVTADVDQASRDILAAGFGYAANGQVNMSVPAGKEPPAKWARPGSKLEDEGVLIRITVRSQVKVINWHRRGDHFCTVSPSGQRSSVAIHTLSKHLSQIPFRKLSGLAQTAAFHPLRPLFFVATQRTIRCYDLQKLELVKVVQPGAKWISSFDIHPGGDNLIVGSYDKRLLWHDLDLSARPYKTMRFHSEAIRTVRYHKGGLPLFADCSDDGTLQIFHGKVPNDQLENPTIVPVKMLKGHKVVSKLGVLDLDWHPREPWCVSAGADGTLRLWT